MGLDRFTGGLKVTVISEITPCSDKINDRQATYQSAAFVKGAWNDVVVHFKFDYIASNNPFFKMWLNGVQFMNPSAGGDFGINCWDDAKGPFFKMGIYGWADVPMTVFYDEIRVGDETSSYAEVAPPAVTGAAPRAPVGLSAK